MNGWIWVAIVLGVLLSIGAWTDWQRRYSGGGDGTTPGEARRDAQGHAGMHGDRLG